jgi:hypothetical protein
VKNFFGKMRDGFIRFMYGRYGVDSLYKFLIGLWFILWIVNLFIGSYILSALMLVLFVYTFFRVLSKNHTKRRIENDKYCRIKYNVVEWFKYQRDRIKDIKVKRYRRCPGCKVALRLPVKKGKHTVVCPRCGKEFRVNIIL